MTKEQFPIMGMHDVPMIGRKSLAERVWSGLTKNPPSNVSLVGPRYIGKTVFLKSLVKRAKQSDSPYSLVIYWQLGYDPPQSDAAFVSQLCKLLHGEMGADAIAYKEHRAELERETTFSALKEVMDLLQMEERSVLMIWDGFDKPLSQGLLSGTLFGQLRDLFYGKRHRIVTATRVTQTELARSKQIEDSPFWNMFDITPVRIGPFDPDDTREALEHASLAVSQGGMKELNNWSGGHPVLLLSILNALRSVKVQELNNEHVNTAAAQVAPEVSEFCNKLWIALGAGAKDALQMLIEHGEVESEKINKDDAKHLLAPGFAVREGAKLKLSCRMFADHVRGSRPDISTLSRMFGGWESYRNEIRTVLELRLKQIPRKNDRLYRLVSRCLDDIPDHPNDCLNNLTSIEEVALDAVWKHECGGMNVIPASVISYWTQHPRDDDNIIRPMMESDDWRIPRDRYKQLAILQRLTGSKIGFDPKSKSVSKDTYVLLNAIHQFRNRTEHADGQSIDEGVAVSALLLCIELLSCLEREIP